MAWKTSAFSWRGKPGLFRGGILVFSPGSPWTHNPPATASPVLRLQAEATTPGSWLGVRNWLSSMSRSHWSATHTQHSTQETARTNVTLILKWKEQVDLEEWKYSLTTKCISLSYAQSILSACATMKNTVRGNRKDAFPLSAVSGVHQPPSFCRLLTTNLRIQPTLRKPLWKHESLVTSSVNQPLSQP